MGFVFFKVISVNKYIFTVDKHKLVEKVSFKIVDQVMEYSRCIAESKWHDQVFKMTNMGFECYFLLIPSYDTDKMVSIS